MPQLLQVERDADGLRMAARELFEESFFAESVKKDLERVNEEEAARILFDEPVRTLSPGYYDRSVYLMDLDSSIEAGIQYTAASLTRDDVMGLHAVKRARNEFERDHPSCPACGIRQSSRFNPSCQACSIKFAGRGN